MNCPNCGAENAEVSLFCTSCGAKLPKDAPTGGAPEAEAAPEAAASQQSPYDAPYGGAQPYMPPTGGYAAGSPYQGAYQQQQSAVGQTYPMTGFDEGLRLANFVLCILSCIGLAFAIIPLAWAIPMTVHSWKIYKGEKPNTTAFGICTLIFVNLIGGILLLVSKKDA